MSVFFYGCVTIDGYLADKNHGLGWLYQTGNVEETGYNDFYKKMHVTLMGKRTFDEIAIMGDAGAVYPTTDNYVFTHAGSLPIGGFVPVAADVVEFVNAMEKSKNIWVVGGNQVMAPLLDNDMIDTMIIQVAPVLLGRGIPLFAQKDALKRFTLEEVNRYGQFAEMVYHFGG